MSREARAGRSVGSSVGRSVARSMALLVTACLAVAACSTGDPGVSHHVTSTSAGTARAATPAPATATARSSLSGGAATAGAATKANVYAYDGAGQLRGAARSARPLVYVPNTLADSIQVIDPATYRVVARYPTGALPQHVVPSFDLTTLWVNDNNGNELQALDPVTGRPGRRVTVEDPYNLYFTPDGAHALVMAERLRRIDVLDAHTMRLQRRLPVPCKGVNHADFSADLSFFVVTCEFSGQLLVIDRDATRVLKVVDLNKASVPGEPSMAAMRMAGPRVRPAAGVTAMPQDVRLTPDGTMFVVADMLRGGVWVVDARTTTVKRFITTGRGAHSVYPDRTGTRLFVANRDAGSITVLDTRLRTVGLWRLPHGGSPDMGGVSADGRRLWLSGRYDSAVYVIDTADGRLLKTIHVDAGPHGLCVWPQPGRFSLGHTGNMR